MLTLAVHQFSLIVIIPIYVLGSRPVQLVFLYHDLISGFPVAYMLHGVELLPQLLETEQNNTFNQQETRKNTGKSSGHFLVGEIAINRGGG